MADDQTITAAPPAESTEGSTGTNGQATTDQQQQATEPQPTETTTPPPEQEFAPLDWRSSLPQDLQRDPTLQRYTSMTEAAKGLVEANKLLGNSIRLPSEDSPEAWSDVWNKLGRPERPDGYTEPEGLELPDGFDLDPSMIQMVRERAHAKGYTQAHYEEALQMHAQWLRGLVNQAEAAQAASYHQGEQELARQFGASAPRLKQEAQFVFEQLGTGVWGGEAGGRLYQKLVDAGFDNDADFVTVFGNLYERMKEGQYLVSDEYPAGVQTPGDVDRDIAELRDKKIEQGRLTDAEEQRLESLYTHKTRLDDARRQREAALR